MLLLQQNPCGYELQYIKMYILCLWGNIVKTARKKSSQYKILIMAPCILWG